MGHIGGAKQGERPDEKKGGAVGLTASSSVFRAKRPRTRGRESARVFLHTYLIFFLKFRSWRFCRYLRIFWRRSSRVSFPIL